MALKAKATNQLKKVNGSYYGVLTEISIVEERQVGEKVFSEQFVFNFECVGTKLPINLKVYTCRTFGRLLDSNEFNSLAKLLIYLGAIDPKTDFNDLDDLDLESLIGTKITFSTIKKGIFDTISVDSIVVVED